MRMRMRMACLAAALAVAVGACGGSSPTSVASGPEETSTSAAPDTSAVSSSSTPQTATTAPTTQARPRVTLPAGGPRGPVDPPNTPAYQLLTAGGNGCQQLLSAVEKWPRASANDPSVNGVEDRLFFLYKAAAEACLLKWTDAKADFDRLQALKPAPTFGTTCSSEDVRNCERCHQLVLEWLKGQLDAFKRDPSYMPTFAKSTAPSPCPASTTSTTRAIATSTTLRR